MRQAIAAEVRLVTGGAAGFGASVQAIPRFPTTPARAGRDLPLRARLKRDEYGRPLPGIGGISVKRKN
jgi:hypothetical protein